MEFGSGEAGGAEIRLDVALSVETAPTEVGECGAEVAVDQRDRRLRHEPARAALHRQLAVQRPVIGAPFEQGRGAASRLAHQRPSGVRHREAAPRQPRGGKPEIEVEVGGRREDERRLAPFAGGRQQRRRRSRRRSEVELTGGERAGDQVAAVRPRQGQRAVEALARGGHRRVAQRQRFAGGLRLAREREGIAERERRGVHPEQPFERAQRADVSAQRPGEAGAPSRPTRRRRKIERARSDAQRDPGGAAAERVARIADAAADGDALVAPGADQRNAERPVGARPVEAAVEAFDQRVEAMRSADDVQNAAVQPHAPPGGGAAAARFLGDRALFGERRRGVEVDQRGRTFERRADRLEAAARQREDRQREARRRSGQHAAPVRREQVDADDAQGRPGEQREGRPRRAAPAQTDRRRGAVELGAGAGRRHRPTIETGQHRRDQRDGDGPFHATTHSRLSLPLSRAAKALPH